MLQYPTPCLVATEVDSAVETTGVDALVHLDNVLKAIAGEPDGQQVQVSAKALKQASLLLHDYRRTLEQMGGEIVALPLRERESVVQAYQSVCQCAAVITQVVDGMQW